MPKFLSNHLHSAEAMGAPKADVVCDKSWKVVLFRTDNEEQPKTYLENKRRSVEGSFFSRICFLVEN